MARKKEQGQSEAAGSLPFGRDWELEELRREVARLRAALYGEEAPAPSLTEAERRLFEAEITEDQPGVMKGETIRFPPGFAAVYDVLARVKLEDGAVILRWDKPQPLMDFSRDLVLRRVECELATFRAALVDRAPAAYRAGYQGADPAPDMSPEDLRLLRLGLRDRRTLEGPPHAAPRR